MKKTSVILLAVLSLFCENIFSQAKNVITLDSFTNKLLNEVIISSNSIDEIISKSKPLSNSSSNNNELIISFDNYSVIYNTSYSNNYIAKIIYFNPGFLYKLFEINFSDYTADDFKKIFLNPNGKPRESGFDTVGYMTKYSKNGKNYDIEMYLFFNKNDGKFNFVSFQF